MNRRSSGSLVRVIVQVVGPLLGLGFIFAAGMKLQRPETAVDLFHRWGLASWAIPVAGWIEFLLGTLLFRPATRRSGAWVLGSWMLLFGILQLAGGDRPAALASLAVLAFAVLVLVTLPSVPFALESVIPSPLTPPDGTTPAVATFLLPLLGVSFLIRWAVGGVVYWAGLPVLAWVHVRRWGSGTTTLTETILLYLLVLGLGVSGLWAFVGHAWLADQVAASIGWAAGSPFQRELAYYHLGLGTAGVLCLWHRDRFWLATGLIGSIFALGAGLVHLQEFLATRNAAPHNWSVTILIGDVVVPAILLVLLRRWLHERRENARMTAVRR